MSCGIDATPSWYLIQCKSRQDERAEENLRRQGYACLRPKLMRERLLRGQRQLVEESLFPGYVFIQLSPLDNWGPLRSTRGILRMVSFGGMPLAINDEIIAELQKRAADPISSEIPAPGEKVRIEAGPFADLEAIFVAMDGDERVVLLLNFLNREQKVRMPLAGIKMVG